MASANSGTTNRNWVISFWKDGHHLGVLSATDERFIEEMRKWAKEKGYRVEPQEREES